MSLRNAIARVLQEAHGKPMHVRDILAGALALGAITTAKEPENIVDFNLYSMKATMPVEKLVGQRMWRWLPDRARQTNLGA